MSTLMPVLMLACFSLISHTCAAQGEEPTPALLFPKDYNKYVAPAGKTTIRVGFEIEDISQVNDNDFAITFIMLTMMNWNDSRLQINDEAFSQLSTDDRYWNCFF